MEFQITEKLKTKEMTENYSGRTTFGDIDFTEDQIEEYKLVFAEFDIDGDGNISVQVTENFLFSNLAIIENVTFNLKAFVDFLDPSYTHIKNSFLS